LMAVFPFLIVVTALAGVLAGGNLCGILAQVRCCEGLHNSWCDRTRPDLLDTDGHDRARFGSRVLA
jgi:hypothetical protein